MVSNIDPSKPIEGSPQTANVRTNFQAAKDEIEALQAGAGSGDMTAAVYDPAGVVEQLIGLTAAQTLTNKTLTTPTINGVVSGTTTSMTITAMTGNVTGNCSGTAATVTGATQAAITSLGILTTLTVDDITIDGAGITGTSAASLTIDPTAGQSLVLDGALDIDGAVMGYTGAFTITGSAIIDGVTIDAATIVGTTAASLEITPTAGQSLILDGALDIDGAIATYTGNWDIVGTGGVGIARTEGTFHCHTGSAGAVTAEVAADDLVVENSASAGISILCPDANEAAIVFGVPSDSNAARINHNWNGNVLQIQTRQGGHSLELGAANGTVNLTLAGGSGVETAVFSGTVTATDGFTVTLGDAQLTNGQLILGNTTDDAASADTCRLGSKDISAGNTALHLETEGTGVIVAGTAATDSSVTAYVNGVRYYLAASTSAPS